MMMKVTREESWKIECSPVTITRSQVQRCMWEDQGGRGAAQRLDQLGMSSHQQLNCLQPENSRRVFFLLYNNNDIIASFKTTTRLLVQ